jgi:adenosylhomocysteine nucleosidase
MGTTAFVCAMPMEMRPLAKRLDLENGEVGGLKVRTGTLDGEPVVGYVTGMGPDLATRGIDKLLAAVRPERVVVFGITGAVENVTPIGTVMMPALVIDHATGRTHEHHPPGGEATKGALWTTSIMTPPSDLPGLIEQGVIALDMETAAYAMGCERDGVPWSVHRTISDHPKDEIDEELFGLMNLDATPNWGNIARYVVKHPLRLAGMFTLAKNGKLATENAADAAIAAARAARAATP